MINFVLRRLLWLVAVLLAVATVTFVLMHMVPGGPWDEGKQLPPSVVENLNRRYGLDQPVWQQYLTYMSRAIRGDLGDSFTRQNQTVTEILLTGIPVTASIAALALALSLAVGLLLGCLAALRYNTWVDYVCVALTTFGASVPNFTFGIVLVIVLSVGLRLVPTSGWGGPQHLLLPVLTLAVFPTAYLARITRAAMLDVVHRDYIRTARAKGLAERVVVLRHMLRNALIPVLTVSGPLAAHLAAGSFIVETLFVVPGIGRMYVQGILARDYGLIMGATLFFALAISLANLIVDVLYAVADPRVRYQ